MKSRFKRKKKVLGKCDYCGNDAFYRFKTGKKSYCCHDNVSKCPAIRKINSEKSKLIVGWKHTEETKEKIRQGNLGKVISEETRAKMKKPKSEEHKAKLRKPKTEEHKAKLKEANKGQIPWNKGLKGSQVAWNKGIPRTEEVKEKIRIAHTGKVLSLEHRQAIGKGNEGGKRSEETRLQMSLAASGERSSQWKGGIAYEPYCVIWGDKDYKQSIKDRDNNECQNTGCWKVSDKLVGHHIDYDKKNCHPWNIITICDSCNSRANNDREQWIKFYQNIMTEKYGYNYDQQIAI